MMLDRNTLTIVGVLLVFDHTAGLNRVLLVKQLDYWTQMQVNQTSLY